MAAKGDPALVKIVFENLLENAWKFTSKTKDADISVYMQEKNDRQCIVIQDNGAGFDMEYSDKLFSAFQRLHTPQEFEGTGIGLATVQRIIHRHGGFIIAEGEVQKGARFYLTFS
jgi:light-regulated signal transduction histidine kinase (bacteriophytochrome)